MTELFHLVQVGSIKSKKVPNLANIFKMENSANEIGIYSKENKYEWEDFLIFKVHKVHHFEASED